MEQISAFTKTRWLVIGIIVLSAALLIVVLLYFASSLNKKQESGLPEQTSVVPTNSLPSTTPVVLPTQKSWNKFENTNFNISYPRDFIVDEGVLLGGGTSTTLSNNTSKVLVEVTNDPANNASVIAKRFIDIGYESAPAKIANQDAIMIAGSRLNVIGEKGYVFDYNGKTYKVMYTYSSAGRDTTKEVLFDTIISTFVPK